MTAISKSTREQIRVPYALRHVPRSSLAELLPLPVSPQSGDIALARLKKMGRNARLELTDGRRCNLHEGDVLAVVFGNRYATGQFEGYANTDGEDCDLLSMAGVCGLVASRHAEIAGPTRLHLLGAVADSTGTRLRLRDFSLTPKLAPRQPRIVVVCGSSMDSGKTHTAMSLVIGLKRQGSRVASIKLTGTASGRDTWTLLDAGASPSLDFVDGGFPSTYLCEIEELLHLYQLLVDRAAAEDADWVVIEIADGVFQSETAELMRSPRFTSTVDAWVLAAGEAFAAAGCVSTVRDMGIEPLAVSGRLSMSPLGVREAEAATGLPCLTAAELQRGDLNERLTYSQQADHLHARLGETAVRAL